MSVLASRLLLVLSAWLLGYATFGSSSAAIGLFALISIIVSTGLTLGPVVAPSYGLVSRTLLGSALFAAVVSIIGCLAYYATNLTTGLLFAVVLVGLAGAFALAKPQELPRLSKNFKLEEIATLIAGLVALATWWYQVSLHTEALRTVAARTLWSVFGPEHIPLLIIALGCALLLAWRKSPAAIPLFVATLFSITSLAALLYPLGFGFDPFIHRATVEHIAQFGSITPKPLYYIGQYVLELMAVKLFNFDLAVVDSLLVPALLSALVPVALAGRRQAFSLGALVLLPLGAFVQTTPMALALVWTAVAIMLPRRPLITPAIFALAALLTHPLAGIPAVMYVLLIAVEEYIRVPTSKQIFTSLIVLGSSVAIPLAFAVQAWQSGLKLNISWQHLLDFKQLPLSSFFGTRFSTFGDLAYTFIDNHFLLVVLLVILTLVYLKKSWSANRPALLVSLSMIISFLILSLIFDFRFLISYERTDFALRLLSIATLFSLPLLSDGLLALKEKIRLSPGLALGLISLLAMAGGSLAYGSYPRHDNYARAAGFNVTEADISAVHAIADTAKDSDYVVLSDQALSAAAVKEFGFAKYYPGDIFYYPIPTGGQLYAIYLDLVENGPTQEKIDQAMNLTHSTSSGQAGSGLVFFAVHNYWWQSDQIIENTKSLTDEWFAIGDPASNAITVFVFRK